MKTEDLIRVLAADGSRPVASIEWSLMRALLLGVTVSALSFAVLHPRPDFSEAIRTFPFVFKLLIVVVLAGTAATLLTATARPVVSSSRGLRLLIAPILLLGGVALELARF